jgi:hypothetical protein
MNSIQFAIASIVDANTGHGLVYRDNKIDYAAAASHGRRIRGKSIAALLGLVKRRLSRHLSGLSDHMLDDIGISRGDVIAVQMGQFDLRDLEARHEKNRSATRLRAVSSTRKLASTTPRSAFDEAVFARAKCA